MFGINFGPRFSVKSVNPASRFCVESVNFPARISAKPVNLGLWFVARLAPGCEFVANSAPPQASEAPALGLRWPGAPVQWEPAVPGRAVLFALRRPFGGSVGGASPQPAVRGVRGERWGLFRWVWMGIALQTSTAPPRVLCKSRCGATIAWRLGSTTLRVVSASMLAHLTQTAWPLAMRCSPAQYSNRAYSALVHVHCIASGSPSYRCSHAHPCVHERPWNRAARRSGLFAEVSWRTLRWFESPPLQAARALFIFRCVIRAARAV